MKKIAAIIILLAGFCIYHHPTKIYAQQPTTIKMISYNILFDGQTNERMQAIADYMIAHQVDILSIQEAWGWLEDPVPPADWTDRKGADAIANYMKTGGWEMPYGTDILERAVKILSRYPVSNVLNYWPEESSQDPQGRAVETARSVIIDVDGKLIRLFVTLTAFKNQNLQFIYNPILFDIASDYLSGTDTVMLTGDFNNTEDEWPIADNIGPYIDACEEDVELSCDDSLNDDYANRHGDSAVLDYAVDHLFVEKNSGWRVVEGYIDQQAGVSTDWPLGLSDHYPLITTLVYSLPGANLVDNGSFEDGTTSWLYSPDVPHITSHSCLTYPPCADLERYLGFAAEDNGVGDFNPYAYSEWIYSYQPLGGKTFTLSFYSMGHEAVKTISNIGLQSRWDTPTSTKLNMDPVEFIPGVWKHQSAILTFPDTDENTDLHVILKPPTDGWPVYYDGVMVQEGAHYTTDIDNSGMTNWWDTKQLISNIYTPGSQTYFFKEDVDKDDIVTSIDFSLVKQYQSQ